MGFREEHEQERLEKDLTENRVSFLREEGMTAQRSGKSLGDIPKGLSPAEKKLWGAGFQLSLRKNDSEIKKLD